MNYIPLLETTFFLLLLLHPPPPPLYCVCVCVLFHLVVVGAVMFAGANVVPDLCGGRNYTLVVCYCCSVNE